MEEAKYDNISSNETQINIAPVIIPQENLKLSHLVKKLSNNISSTSQSKLRIPILQKEFAKEIKEVSEENLSESSVASEDFSANLVPQFINSAGEHNPDLRKFIQVTARKVKQTRHNTLLYLNKSNLDGKIKCRSYLVEKSKAIDPDLSVLSFERENCNEESKNQDKLNQLQSKPKRNTLSDAPDLFNSLNFTKMADMTPAVKNSFINLDDSDESEKEEDFRKKISKDLCQKPPKLVFRKIMSQKDNIKMNQQLEFNKNKATRSRSRSICLMRRKIKFADMIDIDKVEIQPIFTKACGCASILIVDDQYINRFIILKYAEKYGIICEEAEDGEEAVNKCKQAGKKNCCKGFNLVLMDLNMPIMGGIEATQEIIKAKINHEVSPCIEIIAVTAFVSEKEKEKCLGVGMSDFIPKPFTISDFVRLIGVY